MVLPQPVFLGLFHLCQDLVARLARLRVFGMRRVSHLGARGVDHAAGQGRGSDRGQRQGGQESADCHVYLLGFE